MAAVTPWFLGKNLAVVLTPQDRAANGTLSDNAIGALAFTGRLDDSGVTGGTISLKTENISPMDSFFENPVPYEQATAYSITEIMDTVAVSAAANKLRKAVQTSFYAKLVLTLKDNAASPTTIQTETAYVLFEGYDPNYRKGKCVGRGTFRCIDINQSNNPAFA